MKRKNSQNCMRKYCIVISLEGGRGGVKRHLLLLITLFLLLTKCVKLILLSAQNFLNYVLLCLIFTTWLACRRTEERTILTVFRKRGWKYFLLALVDVEANYLTVKAYHFTTVTSVQVSGWFLTSHEIKQKVTPF